MEPQRAQPERQRDDYRQPRQSFHNPSSHIGVVTHLVKLAGILSPLVIAELVTDNEKYRRWTRISSVLTAGLTEVIWATRVKKSSQQHEDQHGR